MTGPLQGAQSGVFVPPPPLSDAELNHALMPVLRSQLVGFLGGKTGKVRIAVVPDHAAARMTAGCIQEAFAHAEVDCFGMDELGLERLSAWAPGVVLVGEDRGKMQLLSRLNAHWRGASFPQVLLAGTAHQEKLEAELERGIRGAAAPSFAHGYPLVKSHLFDALKHAVDRGGRGPVVELGSFQGGTLLFLAHCLSRLNVNPRPRVVGFDTWTGYPERGALLDLCLMPEFSQASFPAVAHATGPHGVELVQGDIRRTLKPWLDRLPAGEMLSLAFVDTDNYSATRDVLPALWDRMQAGGSVVFDHFHTRPEYVNTIGERVAAEEFFFGGGRQDFFHLNGTGVFLKTS